MKTEDAFLKNPTFDQIQRQSYVWKESVKKALAIINVIENYRMVVGKHCHEACDIVHGGGGHWSDFKNQYTLKKFAKDIGMQSKTLDGWVKTYLLVYRKLDKSHNDLSFSKARLVADKVNHKTPVEEIERLLSIETARNPTGDIVRRYLRYSKNFSYTLENNDFADCEEEELQRMQVVLKANVRKIMAVRKKYFPESHRNINH